MHRVHSLRRDLRERAGLFCLVSFLVATTAAAVPQTLTVAVDTDDAVGTGCTVSTVDGPFDGAEVLLTTSVETTSGPDAGMVTQVELRRCQGAAFGAPELVDAGGWPVGVGNGDAGSDVVETYLPRSELGESLRFRFGVVAEDAQGGEDAVLETEPGSRTPIVLDAQAAVIPTLGEAALMLLALAIALIAVRRLGGGAVALLLVGAFALLGARAAWALCIRDGLTNDWSAIDRLASDGTADAVGGGIELVSLYARLEETELCLRVDAFLVFNGPPVAQDDDVSVLEDGVLNGNVLADNGNGADSDPNTDPLMVDTTPVSAPAVGMLTLNADGTFTYTPPADFFGLVTFEYRVFDPSGLDDVGQVSIDVLPVNDAPSFVAGPNQIVAEDAGPQTVVGWATSISVGPANEAGQTASFVFPSNTNPGLFSAGPSVDSAGTLTYTPAPDQNGAATIGVAVMDDGGTGNGGVDTSATQFFDITITAVDDPPTAVDDDVTVGEDSGTTTLSVLANDTDPDGGAISISGVTQPANGTVVNNGTDVDYTPDPDYCNDGVPTDDFTYTLSPGGSIATVRVTVTCVNDPPMVIADSYTTVGNTELAAGAAPPASLGRVLAGVGVLANDSDVEGPLTLTAAAGDVSGPAPFVGTSSLGGDVTVFADGSFLYVPPVGFKNRLGAMADSFGYTVQDTGGLSVNGTVTLEIVDALVWYVHNDPAGEPLNPVGGDGRSNDPFDTLASAQSPISGPGDVIFVFRGDGTNAGQNVGITLIDGQKLFGHRSPVLVLGGQPIQLPPPGARPVIGNGAGDGVTVLADAGNGNRSGIEIRGLEIAGSARAVEIIAADAADADVALSDNSLSSTGGASLFVDGSGTTGTVFVRELTTTGVTGATAGGLIFETVTFDSDLTSGGIQPVAAGDLSVGNPAAPGQVVGDGVRLDNVLGSLQFGELDVGNTGGVGLFVRDAGGKGGSFALTTAAASTIVTVNGPAIDLDPVATTMLFDNVSSTTTAGATPQGILLDTIVGTFQITGTATVNASGGGTVGAGIVVRDSSATVTIGTVDLDAIVGAGISLVNNTGPFTATGGDITGAGGPAFDVDQGSGNVTYGGTINNTAGRSVEVTNHGGPGGGSLITLSGNVTDTGTGVLLDNNDLGAGGTTVGLTGTLSLTTGSSTAFTATNGGVVNVTDPSNNNLVATTTGTGVDVVNTSIGASGVKFTTVNVGDANPAAPNAVEGINLTNAGSGAFTATGGAIQNVTGFGLDVSGGSGAITVGASIGTTSTGRSVEVTTHTGGTVALSGAIDDNGLGIRLENNVGATFDLTGNLDVDTVGANRGFWANSSGTLNVFGGDNEIDTSAGTGNAVEITSTTIGANGVTFRRVDANGATNGIVLSGTGSTGDFEVTGDGASDPLNTTRGRTTAKQGGGVIALGSGGTIVNTTGDAVLLTNATDVTLRNMVLGDATATPAQVADSTTLVGDNGVDLSGVTNLVLDNVLIARTGNDGINGARADNTNNVGLQILHSEVLNAGDAQDEVGLDFGLLTTAGNSLTGTVLIQNSVVDAMAKHGIVVRNFGGTATVTVDNVLVSDNDDTLFCTGATCEGHGIFVNPVGSAGGSPRINLTVEDSEFMGIDLEGVLVSGSGATARNDLVIRRTDFHDSPQGESAIVVFSDAGTNNFYIEDVDITEQDSFLVQLKSGRHLNGTITATGANNVWDGDNGGLSNIGRGIELTADGVVNTLDPQVTVLIEKTNIFDVGSDAIRVLCRDNASAAALCNVTVRNNQLGQNGNPVPGEGLEVGTEDTHRLNLTVTGNTIFSSTDGIELNIDDATVANATISGNTITETGANDELDLDSEKDGDSVPGPSTLCVDVSGNTLGGGSGTSELDEDTGTTPAILNVVQTSAANFASANGIPSGNVTVVGAPNFGAVASCTGASLPTFSP